MRKYAALHSHLSRRNGRPEMLTFEDIEEIIGKPLPQSAMKHRSFWANDNQDHHSHARAWMKAGYRVAYLDREQKVASAHALTPPLGALVACLCHRRCECAAEAGRDHAC
jgi:hypothetical protein